MCITIKENDADKRFLMNDFFLTRRNFQLLISYSVLKFVRYLIDLIRI